MAVGEKTYSLILPIIKSGLGVPDYDWFVWGEGNLEMGFYTYWPINPQRSNHVPPAVRNFALTMSASSFHPGGCNFAFLDGSVHFLRDTIESRNSDEFGNPVRPG